MMWTSEHRLFVLRRELTADDVAAAMQFASAAVKLADVAAGAAFFRF